MPRGARRHRRLVRVRVTVRVRIRGRVGVGVRIGGRVRVRVGVRGRARAVAAHLGLRVLHELAQLAAPISVARAAISVVVSIARSLRLRRSRITVMMRLVALVPTAATGEEGAW